MRFGIRLLIMTPILVIAALLVEPRIGGAGDVGGPRSAPMGDLLSLRSLVEQFKLDVGRYPTTSEGLSALLVCPPGLRDKWRGPYAKVKGGQFLDVWGDPYLYESHGDSFTVYCLGADGKAGGEGRDADLVVHD